MSNSFSQKSKKSTVKIVFLTVVFISILSYVIYYFTYNDGSQNKIKNIDSDNLMASVSEEKQINNNLQGEKIFYLFYLPTCPHCHNAMNYINKNLKSMYKDINFIFVNVSNKSERNFYFKFKKELNILANGVPVAVIGKKYILGFGQGTDEEYIKTIKEELLQKK